MSFFEAVVLGIVQGIFMFFPVSSTSHLALTQHLFIATGSELPPPDSPEMILFDLVVHVGTLVSIVVVFKKSLGTFLKKSWAGFNDRLRGGKDSVGKLYVRLALFGLLSVFVTGLVGFPAKAMFERIFANPLMISATLITTGILLYWTDVLPSRPLGLRLLNSKVALAVGIGQGLALMPGLSRSGTTIAFGLFAGLKRRWAAEYSFFIAIPTILGATLIQGIEVATAGGLQEISIIAMIVGFVVSALVGIAALYLVLQLLYKARLKFFSFYVWGLALVIIVTSLWGATWFSPV
ncbi:undecaprenyl-diphosphate phosphatase [Chitinispirillales bacterium ANBcel5]|uniref:undecaprenyl-diphosphate phosphatase n=1 Tax=Cellulosispirillum alkaliphilum TaxID=3039283 RepID=UPI002A52FC46|nr:undecaprenyl-diphosphate phosphatase [Chitinispirillales bacterium ANBcel5]